MLSNLLNIAIVDDHALFRKTLRNFLSDQKELNVVIQSSDIFDLLNQLKHTKVDILILDIFLPGMNGNDAISLIRGEHPDLRILALSMSSNLELISDLLDAGISGYISKADEPEELLKAIEAAADNKLYRNGLFTEALYWSRQKNTMAPVKETNVTLSEREKRILQLIWEEKSNKEIADELYLGVRSVEKIRQDLKEKIGTKSTVGLLKYGIARKIIYPISDRNDMLSNGRAYNGHL